MSPLFTIPLSLVAAQAPLLETWSTRTGLTLRATEGIQVQPAEGGLALVGPGISLLLAPAQGDTPLQAALASQLAPFLQAGSPAPTPGSVPCTVGGKSASCLEATVEVVPGATLRLFAGHTPGADWVAVCLQRTRVSTELCDGVIKAVQPAP